MSVFEHLPRVTAAATDPRPPGSPPPEPPKASPSYLDAIRWVSVYNASGERVPGGGVVRPKGSDADGILRVLKPNADSGTGLMIAHPIGIPVASFGLATADDLVPAYFDPAVTPAGADVLGSEAGQWWLTDGQTGYVAVGLDNGQGLVEVIGRVGADGEFDAEITGNNGSTPPLYSWKKVTYDSSGAQIDDPGGLTGANNLRRNKSNTPATGTGPPAINSGQWVRIKPIADEPGYYKTDAVGAITSVAIKDQTCTDGVLTGRDLKFTATSPAPPAPTQKWYCMPNGSGSFVCVEFDTTPPQHFLSGPYASQSACQAAPCP